jgi:hypothetical protein
MRDDEAPKPRTAMGAIKTRPFERNLVLTRLGLGAGARIAAPGEFHQSWQSGFPHA